MAICVRVVCDGGSLSDVIRMRLDIRRGPRAVRSSMSLGSVDPLCARNQRSEPGDFLREKLTSDHGPLFSSDRRGSANLGTYL